MKTTIIACIMALIMLIGGAAIGSFILNDCTLANGYNADGTTDAAKYPKGTWAGTCHMLDQVFQVILSPIP